MDPLIMDHQHEPVYRVVRAAWADPLDTSFSRQRPDNRWNPPGEFGALYVCCSEPVARAVTLDILGFAGLVLDDLLPAVRPQLVEIGWSGPVVDVASAEGVAAAGFPASYPRGIAYGDTQPAAAVWHRAGREGVVCRSASLLRMGVREWSGPHERWSELAIFVANAARKPSLLRRRADLEWFRSLAAARAG